MAKKPLLVRDIIHGDMYFDHPLELVIDHKLFQRLKFIVQNGICYQVFPGMTHTRFQHSLGVCHIAIQWFEQLIKEDSITNLDAMKMHKKMPSFTHGQALDLELTMATYQNIKTKKNNYQWPTLVALAALCHDLGHGPFSHLFEEANFIPSKKFYDDIISYLKGAKFVTLLNFMASRYKDKETKVDHEDITLIYLAKIFSDLEDKDDFFKNENNLFITCALISKEFKKHYAKNNKEVTNEINLLSTITSGFIDADRLDYVVRDSKMAGVELGNIETMRITHSLIPCLFKVHNNIENGFLSKYKYHHIIDNFFFNLYQVYTQVIFHPKALQLNHELTLLFKTYSEYIFSSTSVENCLEWHSQTSDQIFMSKLRDKNFDSKNTKLIDKILSRQFEANKDKGVYGVPDGMEDDDLKNGDYTALKTHSRSMMKDGSMIWYYSEIGNKYHYVDWSKISIISDKLTTHSFKPNIYWKNKEFEKNLDELKQNLKKQTMQNGNNSNSA